jgi:hypothetical protein
MGLTETKAGLIKIFKILIAIGSVFALFFLFRWWGLRGLSGLLAGMFIMAYLILSLNPAVMFFVKLFRGNIDVRNFYGRKGDEIIDVGGVHDERNNIHSTNKE